MAADLLIAYEIRGGSRAVLRPFADDESALDEALYLANRHVEAKQLYRWDEEGVGWRQVALIYPERLAS